MSISRGGLDELLVLLSNLDDEVNEFVVVFGYVDLLGDEGFDVIGEAIPKVVSSGRIIPVCLCGH